MKWYEETGSDSSVAVASRIRLSRNLQEYKFPGKLNRDEANALTKELSDRLKRLSSVDGRSYEGMLLGQMDEIDRRALQERQLINSASVEAPQGAGLLVSGDEAVSVTLNSVDHIRLQVSRSGMELKEIWGQIDRLDDCINEMYPYAFDETLGYMTAYPTNVGTGMKAYVVLHLALLDSIDKFSDIVSEIGRYGVNLRPAFGKDRDISGNLYVLFNQKTLGVSEQEIIQIIEKVSGQLIAQEKSLRRHSAENHRLRAEDICLKAYGNLRYCRLMSLQTGMRLLSSLRWGQEEQVVSFEHYCNLYGLMQGIQPASLCVFYKKQLDGEALDQARADYLHRFLPALKE